ncbi:MAG: HEAT repeat domain-containing protein [Phycisphaerae bacterium]|nr:HEAT repeat domain-containing protein [Phycisphaerae bacterium]
MPGTRWFCGLATVWLVPVILAGCRPAMSYQQLIQSPDPKERAKGCKLAGEGNERSAVPLLVDRLEDNDGGVRFWAGWALRLNTGKDFGYRESDTPAARAEAVRRWRTYARTLSSTGGGTP